MNDYIKFLVYIIILDYIWLSIPSNKEVNKTLYETIQRSPLQVNITSMSLFYVFAPLAFIYFIKPVSKTKKEAFYAGCLMGFLMYMTYDLTNKTLFTDFTWRYAIKDVVWGTILFGTISYLVF